MPSDRHEKFRDFRWANKRLVIGLDRPRTGDWSQGARDKDDQQGQRGTPCGCPGPVRCWESASMPYCAWSTSNMASITNSG